MPWDVGHKAQDIVKLSGERLEPEWRIPADGFVPWFGIGDFLLLESLDGPPLRALTGTELAWTLDSRGRGWGRWRDRLYGIDFDDGRLLLADAATGQILERLDVQPRPDEVDVNSLRQRPPDAEQAR